MALGIVAKNGKVTTAMLADVAGIPEQIASTTLKKMAELGLLVWRRSSLRDLSRHYATPPKPIRE